MRPLSKILIDLRNAVQEDFEVISLDEEDQVTTLIDFLEEEGINGMGELWYRCGKKTPAPGSEKGTLPEMRGREGNKP